MARYANYATRVDCRNYYFWCEQKSNNIVVAQICAKQLSRPLITMPSEITVPNISRGHPWALFVAIYEVGVVRWVHFLQHLYQLWGKAIKPTFVISFLVLTFALLGVGVWTPSPLRFFADSKKTAARSAAGFSPTLFFDNFYESFDPGSCKVRSPGQVK